MAQVRLSMRKIKEVLRLKWACGLNRRAIARSVGISHSTVREYLQRAVAAGLSWPLPADLDDAALYLRLYPPANRPDPETVIPVPDWKQVQTQLARRGVTRRLVWLEYLAEHPDGYGYSQFCELYRRWAGRPKPTMRLDHKGGEGYVDYTGMTMSVVDLDTGEVREVQVFVLALGASDYLYAEGQWSQELAHWIDGHVHAFEHLGGAVPVLIPDNLKSGVTHPCRYEPDLNPTYHDFAVHYGVAVLPARVRKPRDKAKVEVGVQVIERWALAPLRDRTFFGLADFNQALAEQLAEINARSMPHLGASRCELLERLDRPALLPLPESRFEVAGWNQALVQIDYHVECDFHFYSVPHTLIGQTVKVRATLGIVEVYAHSQRVASHARSSVRGGHTTVREHMPAAHQAYIDWTPERLQGWAQGIGPDTAQLAAIILGSDVHPQQAEKSVLGIVRLASRFGERRLEAASRHALAHGVHTYRGIHNILTHGLDQVSLADDAPPIPTTHANIRGADYYE
jgi:transposase